MDESEKKTTEEVQTICGGALVTVRKWARKNNVGFEGVGRRKTYLWSQQDVEKFQNYLERRKTEKKHSPKV